jgi:hypothetical protein
MEPVHVSSLKLTKGRFHSPEADYTEYLTSEEASEIHQQFQNSFLKPGCQVMWSGVPREWVQHWADKNGMQTLTTAMGPLMNKSHDSCRKSSKSKKQWKEYVKGASGLFAKYLPKGHVVTVLSRPPPQKFNPYGCSTYQSIEEPVLKGIFGGAAVLRIDMVHFTVVDAESYRYQVWPVDETHKWIENYGLNPLIKSYRRQTKRYV